MIGGAALSLTPPEYIAGQRCHLVRHNPTESQQQWIYPPLVVCVGMAQTVTNWKHHMQSLSRQRDVLVYETAGLGPKFDDSSSKLQKGDNDAAVVDVSLPSQAQRFMTTIRTAFPDHSCFDLAGFSLGGRIIMAATCQQPDLVRKLHLTGVSLHRSDYGQTQLAAWKDHLRNDNLRAFACSAVLASYSDPFLQRQESRLPSWIQGVCDSQTVSGLLALLEQTHNEDGPWTVADMANRLRERNVQGRLLVGECDRIAPVEHVFALAQKLDWNPPTVIPSVGHSVPMEASRVWRDDVLAYLSE